MFINLNRALSSLQFLPAAASSTSSETSATEASEATSSTPSKSTTAGKSAPASVMPVPA
jgi:hypothetical protein